MHTNVLFSQMCNNREEKMRALTQYSCTHRNIWRRPRMRKIKCAHLQKLTCTNMHSLAQPTLYWSKTSCSRAPPSFFSAFHRAT